MFGGHVMEIAHECLELTEHHDDVGVSEWLADVERSARPGDTANTSMSFGEHLDGARTLIQPSPERLGLAVANAADGSQQVRQSTWTPDTRPSLVGTGPGSGSTPFHAHCPQRAQAANA